jgi:rubredoxin
MNHKGGVDGPNASHPGGGARDGDLRMECRICWYRYDPAEGDPGGGVPPGTSFGDLPAAWCCPRCDSDKSYFLSAM